MSNKLTILEKMNNYFANMQKMKTKDKVVFYRLLSTLSNAWVGLVKSVSIIERQEKNPVVKNILGWFLSRLRSWKKLSECMEAYFDSFGEAEIWIIRSWEKTWKLNSVLIDLADQLEKIASINWKIRWALVYPWFIMLVVFAVIFIMMTVVVPGLLKIFEDKEALPDSTKLLMTISDFMVNYWYLIIGWMIWVYVLIQMWRKTPSWNYLFDKALFRIPVLWETVRKIILSKFSRVFVNLVASWISVVESLRLVSDIVWNEVYRQRILLLAQDVKSGIKIHQSLEWDPLFPDMMVQMIQVWEETANLDDTITKIADFYDEEVDNTINTLNKLLEPFIIIFLAVIVWFIAMAIMEPIMGLADAISD